MSATSDTFSVTVLCAIVVEWNKPTRERGKVRKVRMVVVWNMAILR